MVLLDRGEIDNWPENVKKRKRALKIYNWPSISGIWTNPPAI